jgi:neutral trehalase
VASACESGWDFSSRWLADGRSLSSIRTTQVRWRRQRARALLTRGARLRAARLRLDGDRRLLRRWCRRT